MKILTFEKFFTMKRFVFPLILLLATLVRAQNDGTQINNSDFEQWINQNQPETWNCSINLGFQTVYTGERTSDAHGGNYAIELTTQNLFSYEIPGMVQLGEVIFDNNNVQVVGGYPLNDRPQGVKFFVKYLPVDQDTAFMFCVLTRYDTANHKTDTIGGTAMIFTDTIDQYTEVLLPIIYDDSVSSNADSINIIFLSSIPKGSKNFFGEAFKFNLKEASKNVGSTLFVDDLELIYGFEAYPTYALPPEDVKDVSFVARWFPSPMSNEYVLDVATDENFNNILPAYDSLIVSDTNKFAVEIPASQPSELFYRVRVKYGDTAISNYSNTVKVIPPYAPTALDAVDITPESFTAVWSARKYVSAYYLDVAYDPDFTNFLTGFQNHFVADTFYTLTNLDSNTTYYYRVKAQYTTDSISPYSNVIEVSTAQSGVKIIAIKHKIIDDRVIVEGLPANSELMLYDISGRLVSHSKYEGKATVILPSKGIFVLKIISPDFSQSIKIVNF